MWQYLVNFIAGAVFPLALAGYGGHLATLALPEKSKQRRNALILVWTLAILGVGSSAFQQYVSFRSDNKRSVFDSAERSSVDNKLDSISTQLGRLLRNAKTGRQQAEILSTQEQVNSLKSSLGVIAKEASNAPKRALIASRINLENAVITSMETSGYANSISTDPIANVRAMQNAGYFSKDFGDACIQFLRLEDRLVNTMATSQEEFRLASQTGRWLTKTLKGLPSSVYVVLYADVPLYSDPEGKRLVSNATGLIIRTTITATGRVMRQVFPTTRTGYYKRGMVLTWEWRNHPKWGATWYRDPETHKIKLAFLGSLDFVPRDVKERLLRRPK